MSDGKECVQDGDSVRLKRGDRLATVFFEADLSEIAALSIVVKESLLHWANECGYWVSKKEWMLISRIAKKESEQAFDL